MKILVTFISLTLTGLLAGFLVSQSCNNKADRLSGELAQVRPDAERRMAEIAQRVYEVIEADNAGKIIKAPVRRDGKVDWSDPSLSRGFESERVSYWELEEKIDRLEEAKDYADKDAQGALAGGIGYGAAAGLLASLIMFIRRPRQPSAGKPYPVESSRLGRQTAAQGKDSSLGR